MNKTITLIIPQAGGNQLIAGGFEMDEAGLALCMQTLRTAAQYIESQLIRLQVQREMEKGGENGELSGEERE